MYLLSLVAAAEFANPLEFPNLQSFLSAILTMVTVMATPIIIFFIIYAGFLYVTAQGNEEKTRQASSALMYAIIGGVIILGAHAIMAIVGNTVNQF